MHYLVNKIQYSLQEPRDDFHNEVAGYIVNEQEPERVGRLPSP